MWVVTFSEFVKQQNINNNEHHIHSQIMLEKYRIFSTVGTKFIEWKPAIRSRIFYTNYFCIPVYFFTSSTTAKTLLIWKSRDENFAGLKKATLESFAIVDGAGAGGEFPPFKKYRNITRTHTHDLDTK